MSTCFRNFFIQMRHGNGQKTRTLVRQRDIKTAVCFCGINDLIHTTLKSLFFGGCCFSEVMFDHKNIHWRISTFLTLSALKLQNMHYSKTSNLHIKNRYLTTPFGKIRWLLTVLIKTTDIFHKNIIHNSFWSQPL